MRKLYAKNGSFVTVDDSRVKEFCDRGYTDSEPVIDAPRFDTKAAPIVDMINPQGAAAKESDIQKNVRPTEEKLKEAGIGTKHIKHKR